MMAHASEYLPLALERAVISVFPGIEVPILPLRQFGKLAQQVGKPVQQHGGKPVRNRYLESDDWSSRCPDSARRRLCRHD